MPSRALRCCSARDAARVSVLEQCERAPLMLEVVRNRCPIVIEMMKLRRPSSWQPDAAIDSASIATRIASFSERDATELKKMRSA